MKIKKNKIRIATKSLVNKMSFFIVNQFVENSNFDKSLKIRRITINEMISYCFPI